MSVTPVPATLDVSGTASIPFQRLVRVELRKSADTRAGRWLIGITFGLTLIADLLIAIILALKDEAVMYGDLVAGAAFGSSLLLPVLGIMLVTSEWSQRTAMTTFALEPRRTRVVLAKMVCGRPADRLRDRIRAGRRRLLQPPVRRCSAARWTGRSGGAASSPSSRPRPWPCSAASRWPACC